jgi:hypothetical protein
MIWRFERIAKAGGMVVDLKTPPTVRLLGWLICAVGVAASIYTGVRFEWQSVFVWTPLLLAPVVLPWSHRWVARALRKV